MTKPEMIQLIVDKIKADPNLVLSQFVLMSDSPPYAKLTGEELKQAQKELLNEATNVSNWSSSGVPEIMGKYSSHWGRIEYSFNCDPLEDQLRAYLYFQGEELKYVDIQGE